MQKEQNIRNVSPALAIQVQAPIDKQRPESWPLRSIDAIIEELSKPIADRHLRTRRQGGKDITYVEWHTAVRYLDHFAPGWSFEIRNVTPTADRFVVTARISIPCLE